MIEAIFATIGVAATAFIVYVLALVATGSIEFGVYDLEDDEKKDSSK